MAATTNVSLTAAWSQVAADTDAVLLLQAPVGVEVEVAVVATETAPTVAGHRLYGPEMAITRATIGAGYVYARAINAASATLVVTKGAE
jgi:hypothetical protein